MGPLPDRTDSAAGASTPATAAPAEAPDLAVLAALFVALDGEQGSRLRLYRRLLAAWNDRFNLTAVTDPAEMDRRLFLDALRLVPALDEAARPPTGRRGAVRLVDIGSGAGFPGLVLKVARPALDVTLVEATGKKVDFLRHVVAELGLAGVEAIHARAEDLGRDPAYRGAHDVATARAVASLPALLEIATPLLRVGGWGLFPKGLDLDAELAAGERAGRLVGTTIRRAARLGEAATRLVVVEKTAPTPARYPRRAGLPAREPLGGPRVPAPTSTSRRDVAADGAGVGDG